MPKDDLGLGGSVIPKNKKPNKTNNMNVTKVCRVTAIILGFLVFIGGFIFIDVGLAVAIGIWLGGFVSSLLIYAIGELVRLLSALNDNVATIVESINTSKKAE